MSAEDGEAELTAALRQMQATVAASHVVAAEQASEHGRFAAREFVARWSRETGEVLSAVVTDRMLFAYEMGYLRGHGDGTRASMALYDELERKGNDADSE